ncbi:hypothetical protein BO94DRAFT_174545 [Aspergillus sclerotioniger CBS 115572]|uniref:Zn(2)-C6 fungal-type domain-containing protein n=1 Tax=Aspergillus sclerotioniger CBS 115572 TaxID=1450535 RepID=A0A317VYT3_9EURO|nr:hypothetical protein BO94DRAFT_174545 [Aspergillus sclerotioniger CBS 115572]PWY79526.1 hypothetical protein BO94DRAFT_174545 [Aspergillus sclerotioniger CBS 115572]
MPHKHNETGLGKGSSYLALVDTHYTIYGYECRFLPGFVTSFCITSPIGGLSTYLSLSLFCSLSRVYSIKYINTEDIHIEAKTVRTIYLTAIMAEYISISPSLSPSTTTTTPPPKTRDTCDACAKSKVRCGKQHPRCERCVARNQPCMYGFVRPRGRPRLCPMVGMSPGGSGLEYSPSGKGVDMVQCGMEKGLGRTPTHVLGDMIVAGGQREGGIGDGNGWQGLGCEVGGLFDIVPQGEEIVGMHGGYEMGLMSSSPSSSGSGSGESSLEAGNSGQSCMGMVLSILQSLHSPSETCLLQASVPPSRTLDAILRLNQSAMGTLISVMGCPCSLEHGCAVLIAQVLVQVLDWYRVVLEMDSGMGIGESELDEEDRKRRVVQVVMNDLEKVRMLVEGFARAYCREGVVGVGDSRCV